MILLNNIYPLEKNILIGLVIKKINYNNPILEYFMDKL